MITCILLSAGLSERFGSPKALASIGASNAIQHVQNTLLESCCDQIIVVLGAHARQVETSIFLHPRIRVVHNKNYFLGQTSSLQAGWREADKRSTGTMFLPVDCPLVKTSSIDTIIDHFKAHGPDLLIPTYQQRKGHPPIFHQRMGPAVLELRTDQGINSLFASHPPQTVEINDPGIVKSFNTPEELRQILS